MTLFSFDRLTLRHCQGYIAQMSMPEPLDQNHPQAHPIFTSSSSALNQPLEVQMHLDAQQLTCYQPHSIEVDTVRCALALQSDATAVRIMNKAVQFKSGDYVGVRLNLNVLKNTGVAVQSIHGRIDASPPFSPPKSAHRGLFDAPVCSYAPVVVLKDAHFCVNQQARHQIASGQSNKFPMASIDGYLDLDALHQLSHQGTQTFVQGVAIRFYPIEHHLFVDPNGFALAYAEHVVIVGHRAYAHGQLRYHSGNAIPAPSIATKTRFLDQLFTHPVPTTNTSCVTEAPKVAFK